MFSFVWSVALCARQNIHILRIVSGYLLEIVVNLQGIQIENKHNKRNGRIWFSLVRCNSNGGIRQFSIVCTIFHMTFNENRSISIDSVISIQWGCTSVNCVCCCRLHSSFEFNEKPKKQKTTYWTLHKMPYNVFQLISTWVRIKEKTTTTTATKKCKVTVIETTKMSMKHMLLNNSIAGKDTDR